MSGLFFSAPKSRSRVSLRPPRSSWLTAISIHSNFTPPLLTLSSADRSPSSSGTFAAMASATPPQPEPLPFTAQAPLQNGMKAGALFAGAGTFVSAIQNAIGEHKAGAMGVFTRTGSTIAFFAAMGGSYSYVSSAAANFREKNDALNAAAGGCASGMVYGASGECGRCQRFNVLHFD